jgi:hypothetical protein
MTLAIDLNLNNKSESAEAPIDEELFRRASSHFYRMGKNARRYGQCLNGRGVVPYNNYLISLSFLDKNNIYHLCCPGYSFKARRELATYKVRWFRDGSFRLSFLGFSIKYLD